LSIYFSLANNRIYLQRDVARMKIWFPLFSYFESNVQTAVPNEYSCPELLTKCRLILIRHSISWFCLVILLIFVYTISFTKTIDFSSLLK